LLVAPICQGIGTGNSPFAIAASAGALWLGGAAVMIAVFAPVRGPWMLPVGAGAAVACGIALLLGAPSLWLYPFRASPDLRFQTTPVLGVPRLAGLTTDASTATFLRDTYSFMKANGLTGRTGFSSFDGTGLAYALELAHPPAGLYTEELMPRVLERRLLDACEHGFIGPSALPVVLAADDKVPAVTANVLHRCGIDFPASYSRKSFPVSTYLKEFGMKSMTIWYPNPNSSK
jgi:hypothetical protein